MERFHFLLPVILVAYTGTAIGQTHVLPSSDAMNTIKNISTPVNYYTGTAGVTIPLMQLSGKELTVPVTLSYNCSGHKVQEIAGSVGLGWNLSAGGMVTRVIRSKPDEEASPGSSGEEEAPDLFFYSFCGQGGKFFFDQDMKLHTMPHRNLKISFTQSANNSITAFEILDENGVKYVFGTNGETESTRVTQSSESTLPDGVKNTPKTHASSWLLTKINNANRTESIDFTYVESSYSITTVALVTNIDKCGAGGENFSSETELTQRLVSSITSSMGRIDFTYASNRKDLRSTAKYLTNFSLVNSSGTTLQNIRLSYSYFQAGGTDINSYRLRLDKIYDQQSQPLCTFTYNTSVNLPARTSMAIDYWGYYNGNANATTLYPREMMAEYFRASGISYSSCTYTNDFPYTLMIGSDRKANETYASANTLNRIDTRGGSYKIFEYDGHHATFKGDSVLFGGVRIKSMVENNGISSLKRQYEYVKNDTTSGLIYSIPKFAYVVSSTGQYDNAGKHDYVCTFPLYELTDQNNIGVGYSRVVEKMINGDDTPAGSTIYQYTNFDQYNDDWDKGYRRDNSNKRGHLLSNTIFDAGGNKIKEDTYTYHFDLPIIHYQRWVEKPYWRACGSRVNLLDGIVRKFQFIEKSVRLTSQTSTTYRNGLSQSMQTNYEYNNLGQVSSTTQWNTNNATEKYKTETTYLDQVIEASDKSADKSTAECDTNYSNCITECGRVTVSDPQECANNCSDIVNYCTERKQNRYRDVPDILVTLVERNQINVPIETVSSIIKNDSKTVLSAQFNLFGEERQEKVYLKESYSMNEPVTDYKGVTVTKSGFTKAPHLRLLSTVNSIDDKGNITQQTDKYGISTAYTYDNLSVPTQTTVTSNADVRTSTVAYIPLVGTTSKTDANSLSSYTDYDTLWRVKFSKDQNQDVVKRNQYHSAGESIRFDLSGNTSGCLSNSFTFEVSNMAYTRGNPPTFLWEFGDGKSTRTTAASVTHTWTTAGTYNVRVTAFNDVYEPVVQNRSVEILSEPSFDLTETESGVCRFTVTSNYTGTSGIKEWQYMLAGPPSTALEWISIPGYSDSFSLGREDVETAGYYRVALKITDSCGEATRYLVLDLTCN